jgi:hypothetical protein
MIQYVELIPTKDAPKEGCVLQVLVPVDYTFRKVMAKNGAHIRLYYETQSEAFDKPLPTYPFQFLLAPTGVDCEAMKGKDSRYIDSVELFADTVIFHIYRLL